MKKHKMQKNSSIRSGLITSVQIMSFLLPLPLYILFTTFVFPAPNSAFLFLGIIGSLFLGVGFGLLAGILNGTYIGHIITCIPLVIGIILILISSCIMYIPSIYATFDEQYVSLYFMILSFLFVSAIWYLFFRMTISRILRSKGISKTTIKKLTRGARNYWWYESIHNTYYLGWKFFLNKWFTILYPGVITLHLLFGWYRPLIPIVVSISSVIFIMNAVMWIPVCRSKTKGNSKSQKDNTELSMILGVVFPVFMCIAMIIFAVRIWD